MTTEEQSISPVSKKTRAERLSTIRKIWPWFFLILMVIVFAIISKTTNDVNFISYRSVQGILVYATQILLIGLAETIIIISGNGGVDLSVHYILGFSVAHPDSRGWLFWRYPAQRRPGLDQRKAGCEI